MSIIKKKIQKQRYKIARSKLGYLEKKKKNMFDETFVSVEFGYTG